MLSKLKSKIARWAVLRNKMEALRILVNQSDIYVIMSALRGPDTENEYLKWVFTARIRHLAGMDCESVGSNCRDEKVVSFKDVIEALKSVNADDRHYLNHVKMALMEFKYKGLIDRDEFLLLYELADILEKVAVGYYSRDGATTLIMNIAKKYRHLLEECEHEVSHTY